MESDSAYGPSLSPARGDDNSTPGTKLAVARATPAVLIVLAGPSVTEARDLNDKPVVIAGLSTISRADIGAALAAAGAGAAELTEGRKSDIDQLIGGQVSAAVVAFLSPAKAAEFPEIPGFTLLRIVVADPHGG